MNNIIKRKWLPESRNGKIALWLCGAAVVYGILMPSIPPPVVSFFSGLVVVSIEFLLLVFALYFSFKAIVKERERAILALITFGFFCLVGGFWILFALGEIISPH